MITLLPVGTRYIASPQSIPSPQPIRLPRHRRLERPNYRGKTTIVVKVLTCLTMFRRFEATEIGINGVIGFGGRDVSRPYRYHQMYVVGHHYVIIDFSIGIMNRYGFQSLQYYLSKFAEKHFPISDPAEHMPLFMTTNRDEIYSVIVVMPLRSESVSVSHFGLFSEGY